MSRLVDEQLIYAHPLERIMILRVIPVELSYSARRVLPGRPLVFESFPSAWNTSYYGVRSTLHPYIYPTTPPVLCFYRCASSVSCGPGLIAIMFFPILIGLTLLFSAYLFTSYWRLRHIPGPFLASFSKLWLLKWVIRAELHIGLFEACEKYGPIPSRS